MDKRILFVLFAVFLILPIVSAFEFDNVKEYDASKQKITFYNSILGIKTTEIGTARLETPLNHYVMKGNDVLVAIIEINLSETSYADVLKNIKFYDLANRSNLIERNFTFREKEIRKETFVYTDFDCKPTGKINITGGEEMDCKPVVKSYDYDKIYWVNSKKTLDLTKGTVVVGLFTEVKDRDVIEWGMDIFGVDVLDVWATWTESFNTGLQAYYKMDTTVGGKLLDSYAGRYNATINDPSYTSNSSGIINNCSRSNTPNGANISISTGLKINSTEMTVNMWVQSDNFNNDGYSLLMSEVRCNGDSSFVGGIRTYTGGTNNQIWFRTRDNVGLKAIVLPANAIFNDRWNMITYVINSTSLMQYVNGTFSGNLSLSGWNTTTLNAPIYLANREDGYCGADGTIRMIDEVGIWNRTLTSSEVTSLYNSGTGITYTEAGPGPTISVTQNSPDNAYKSSNTLVTFNWTVYVFNTTINNWTLSVWYSNGSNAHIHDSTGLSYTVNTSFLHNDTFFTDNNYIWGVRACGTMGNLSLACATSTNRTFQIHTTAPFFILNNLSNVSTITLPVNATFNITTSDPELGACRYTTSDNVSSTTYTCNTTQNVRFLTGGQKNLTVYANDTFGNTNQSTYFFNIYDFMVNVTENGDPIAEGGQSILYLRINSTSFPIGDADASIMWNGTTSSPTTKSVLDTNTILFTYTFPISAGMGNSTGIPYAYNWTYNATQLTTRTTPTATQTIISFGIDNCALYTTQIANFTLKDEETTAVLTPATKIEIETLTTSALYSGITWSYFNTFTNVSSIKLCVPAGVLNNTNYTIDITASYEGDNHVKEFWYLDNGTLAKNQAPFNSYTAVNVSLYDLLTTDSTTFLLEFTDKNGLEVPESIVHVYRKYIGAGTYREVERARQDNNGQTHVHLVEEDVIYYFTVSLEGRIIYTSDEYNAKCLATICTITLSASPTDQNWSIIDNEGGRYAISMNRTSRIVRTTFSLDTLSLVNSSVYRFNNGNYSLINQSSLTATAGTIDVYIPVVYDNSSFFVAIYKDNVFIKSAWVSFRESAKDYFGTFGAILGGLIVLTMILMAVSEGAGLILFTIFGLIIITIMSLVDLGWASTISLICAGGIIIWKLMKRRNRA